MGRRNGTMESSNGGAVALAPIGSADETRLSPQQDQPLRSLEVYRRGVGTASQLGQLMLATIGDTLEGHVGHQFLNATANGVGKICKTVELRMSHGVANEVGEKELNLFAGHPPEDVRAKIEAAEQLLTSLKVAVGC